MYAPDQLVMGKHLSVHCQNIAFARGEAMVLETFVVTFGYLGVFLLVFALNTVPFFMPPTWIVLSTLYFMFPQQLNPLLLALTGAFASTFGRAVLCRIGVASRGLMGQDRKRSLDRAGQALRSKKHGGFLLSFLFALSPLPSNVFFLTMGTMRCHFFTIFLGFWLGRLLSYAVTINIAHIGFKSLADVLASQIQAEVLVNSLAILSTIVLAFIDWEKLIQERRIAFLKPKLA
jgi:membrane protein YqaA with SNARE-associated domain